MMLLWEASIMDFFHDLKISEVVLNAAYYFIEISDLNQISVTT